MESPENTLDKPNASLVMIPKVGKLTAVERKLFNSILMSSISQFNEHRDTHGAVLDGNHTYSAPADELLDVIEVGESNLKGSLRKYMLSLRRSEVEWEAPDAKSGVIWSNTTVLPRAEMELREGRLWARWKLSDELTNAISNTKEFPFTRLDLAQIAKLSGYTDVALYEICARYRNNYLKGGDGICLTSASEPDWWVDALTNVIPKADKKTGEVKRREWRKVKSELVLKAIKEINEKTDLNVELIEKKENRSVVLIQFSVRQKRGTSREVQSGHFDLIKKGLRMGISQARIETALLSNSKDEVSLALAKFEGRFSKKELDPIEKPNSYFASILKDLEPIDIVADKVAPTLDKPQVDPVKADLAAKHTVIRDEFMALPDSIKADFAQKALAALKERRMATPRMIENANSGVWAPLLLAEMINTFTKEKDFSVVDTATEQTE